MSSATSVAQAGFKKSKHLYTNFWCFFPHFSCRLFNTPPGNFRERKRVLDTGKSSPYFNSQGRQGVDCMYLLRCGTCKVGSPCLRYAILRSRCGCCSNYLFSISPGFREVSHVSPHCEKRKFKVLTICATLMQRVCWPFRQANLVLHF